MITGVLTKIFGSKGERDIKKLQPIVEQINALEPDMQSKSDEALKAQTALFRQRLESGATLDDILSIHFFSEKISRNFRVIHLRTIYLLSLCRDVV